jgi:hypothetical protein
MVIDGQQCSGRLSAQAGERFPGPGPGCGLGAGELRQAPLGRARRAVLGRRERRVRHWAGLLCRAKARAHWAAADGFRAQCTVDLLNRFCPFQKPFYYMYHTAFYLNNYCTNVYNSRE